MPDFVAALVIRHPRDRTPHYTRPSINKCLPPSTMKRIQETKENNKRNNKTVIQKECLFKRMSQPVAVPKRTRDRPPQPSTSIHLWSKLPTWVNWIEPPLNAYKRRLPLPFLLPFYNSFPRTQYQQLYRQQYLFIIVNNFGKSPLPKLIPSWSRTHRSRSPFKIIATQLCAIVPSISVKFLLSIPISTTVRYTTTLFTALGS